MIFFPSRWLPLSPTSARRRRWPVYSARPSAAATAPAAAVVARSRSVAYLPQAATTSAARLPAAASPRERAREKLLLYFYHQFRRQSWHQLRLRTGVAVAAGLAQGNDDAAAAAARQPPHGCEIGCRRRASSIRRREPCRLYTRESAKCFSVAGRFSRLLCSLRRPVRAACELPRRARVGRSEESSKPTQQLAEQMTASA